MPAVGGESRAVPLGTPRTEAIRGLAWAPDQKALFYVRGGQLWRVPAAGGEAEATGISGISTPHLHPDGRQIVFEVVEGTRRVELRAFENFLPGPRAAK